jgi:hypothetical protein
LNTAYVFGLTGNLAPENYGSGWSVEDTFAWTVGTSSELTLPLPGDDLTYVMHCDIRPALFGDAVPRQRLTVCAGETVLGGFELAARGTIAVELPQALTSGARSLRLTLLHPDAARPSDHAAVNDSRVLALCFSSAALVEAGSGDSPADQTALQGIFAGGMTAQRIAEIAGKLPSLRGRLATRFVDMTRADTPADPLAKMPQPIRFCWLDISAGAATRQEELINRLPDGCTLRTFYTPAIEALWPFAAPDERSRPEPRLYHPSRYPHGDRHAIALAGTDLPDEMLYLMYEMAAKADAIDLDALFAGDLRRWRGLDRQTDVKLAGFIESRIGSSRLFMSPTLIGPDLLKPIAERIVTDLPGLAVADPVAISAELDSLLDGHAGWRNELPIHRRVAEHFRLAWWSPEMKYRWQNNLRTYREHVLDSIRWAGWRP